MALERKGRNYPVEEVLPHLETCQQMKFDNDRVKMMSHRYRCFVKSGVDCVKCGLKGEYFCKEKNHDKERTEEQVHSLPYHWNLYGLGKEGEEIMLTKDHIKPKAKGGENKVENYQTMCQVCNVAKADDYEESN